MVAHQREVSIVPILESLTRLVLHFDLSAKIDRFDDSQWAEADVAAVNTITWGGVYQVKTSNIRHITPDPDHNALLRWLLRNERNVKPEVVDFRPATWSTITIFKTDRPHKLTLDDLIFEVECTSRALRPTT